MRAFNKLILFGMILTPLIFTGSTFACFTNTFAYFSDVEYSTGNTLTAAVWDNEAGYLTVSDSKLTGNGEKLHGITLDVSGTQSVTIDKIQVWWDTTQGDASHITEIKIGGQKFFSGSKSVGEVIDGTDYVLAGGSSAKLEFYFDSDVSSLAPFTINIIMGDGSVKSFVTDPKYRSDVPETSLIDSEIEIMDLQAFSEIDTGQSEQIAPVTDTENNGQEQEESVIDTESQNIPEAPVIDAEEESQDGQEIPIVDAEENQEEESQEVKEESITDTAGQDGQDTVADDAKNEQDALVTATEDSPEPEKSLVDTGKSQDVSTSTAETEEENQDGQEVSVGEKLVSG